MKNFETIQSELAVWHISNFDSHDSNNSLLGMVEETGELAHVILKNRQQIRIDNLEFKKKDAIGDIAIFTFSYLNSIGIPFKDVENKDDIFRTENSALNEVSLFFKLQSEISKVIATHTLSFDVTNTNLFSLLDNLNDGIDTIKESIKNIFVYLDLLSWYTDKTIFSIVAETWETVSKRNWKKYPKNGVSE